MPLQILAIPTDIGHWLSRSGITRMKITTISLAQTLNIPYEARDVHEQFSNVCHDTAISPRVFAIPLLCLVLNSHAISTISRTKRPVGNSTSNRVNSPFLWAFSLLFSSVSARSSYKSVHTALGNTEGVSGLPIKHKAVLVIQNDSQNEKMHL